MNYKFDAKEHAHFLDGSPLYGTSTVIKEVMPPFLAKWGAQCAVDYIKATAEKRELDYYEDKESLYQVFRTNAKHLEEAVLAWSKVRKDAAEKGTDMHAELERYVGECIQNNKGAPFIVQLGSEWSAKTAAFSVWALASVDRFVGSEIYTYSKELWTGGIVDCLAVMIDGSMAVIDFKSSKEAYFNQFAQAAGYALQLMESGYGDAQGGQWQTLKEPISKLIVVPFGGKELKPEVIENVQGYADVFKSLVQVYSYLRSFKAA